MSLTTLPTTLPPIVVSAGVGQLEVPDDSHPGLRRGDRIFTAPCHRFRGDDLYVLSFPGEHYGLWRCASTITPKNPGIFIWKEGRYEETLRRLTTEEFGNSVVAMVAGLLHIRDNQLLYPDRDA